VGPVSDDVAARASFLRRSAMRSGKTEGSLLQGWACSPPCCRVWGATAVSSWARNGTPSREKRHRHAPFCS